MIYARCKCFFMSNIYLKNLGHVTFENEQQFFATYGPKLLSSSETVLSELKAEIERRRNIPFQSKARAEVIRANYLPLHPDIFNLKEESLDPDFLQLHKNIQQGTSLDLLIKGKCLLQHEDEVYSFPLFTESFCKKILSELDHFNNSSVPKGRPNSMNNYGVLLDELGMNEGFLTLLRSKYFQPLSQLLFPEADRHEFDSHKAFTVDYEEGKDIDLALHFDNAEVTVNICLSADCEGGELYFGSSESNRGFGYVHCFGRAVIHRGSALHCVLPVVSGRRVNMVMWMRSSAIRNQCCPMCNRVPDLEPVEDGWGDGFTLDK